MADKVGMSSVRVHTYGCNDEQIWVQSSLAPTYRLQRRAKEDFSFTNTDIALVSNRGGDISPVMLECVRAGTVGLFVGSNRRGGFPLREGQSKLIQMKPGEVLTVRDIDAREKMTGVEMRPGQSVVMG